jgi:hypothetical protein
MDISYIPMNGGSVDDHSVFFTIGENIGQAGSTIPQCGNWLDIYPAACISGVLYCSCSPNVNTTGNIDTGCIMGPHEDGPVVAGTSYSGKSREFNLFKNPKEILFFDTSRQYLKNWQMSDQVYATILYVIPVLERV